MLSVIAASLIAAAVPSDRLSSVAVAAYWYKKDERGKGDEISELAKPRRFPAFAVSEDMFLVADPLVRAKHLDRIELSFRGDKVPAKEIARTMDPDVVVLQAGRPLKDVKPLAFRPGEPAEKLVWKWRGDTLTVSAAGVGTNDAISVVATSGRVFRKGEPNALYVDKDRNPVWLDFGARFEVPDGKFEYVLPAEWTRLPADDYEKSAAAIESRLAKATLAIVARLETDDEDGRRRGGGRNEIDLLGFVVAGRVLVPSKLDGDEIAHLGKVEATFPDGSTTNLVFAGALAEWNAIVFDIPEGFREKVEPLALAKGAAEDFDNRVAWLVSAEDENGRIVATAERRRFCGVSLVRGGGFVPNVNRWSTQGEDEEESDFDDDGDATESERRSDAIVLDADGNIARFSLERRFAARRWSDGERETVSADELSRILAGECFNPEFMPRKEEERGRIVWLGVESVRLTGALAREKKVQSFLSRYWRAPCVTEIYPDSPAAKAGLEVDDVLLAVCRGSDAERPLRADYDDYSSRDWNEYFESDSTYVPSSTPWPSVENSINELLSQFGVGAKVRVVYVRNGVRRETPVVLEAAPVHYRNATKARNRTLGLSVRDMTFEVRRYFKFDDKAPGVVIAKVKPGSPVAVAGLKPYELVTEVNGEKVSGAKDFAAKIKGKKDLVFAVRRLAQTRMVRIHVEPDADAEKGKGKEKAK